MIGKEKKLLIRYKLSLSTRYAGVLAHCCNHGYYIPSKGFLRVCSDMEEKGWLKNRNGKWHITPRGGVIAKNDRTTQGLLGKPTWVDYN